MNTQLDRPPELIQLLEQADQYRYNGQTQTALELLLQAKQLAEQQQSPQLLADTYHLTGVCHFLEQNYNASLQSFQSAISLYQTLDNPVKLGNVYRDMGSLYMYTGQYHAAQEWLQASVELLSHNKDESSLAITLTNLGLTYHFLGQVSQAKQQFKDGLSLVRHQLDWYMEMTILFSMARADLAQKKYHQMVTKLWAALGLIYHDRANDKQQRRLSQIYGMLAIGYLNLGNCSSVVAFLKQSLKLTSDMPIAARDAILHDIDIFSFLTLLRTSDIVLYQTLLDQYPFLSPVE